MNAHIDVEAQVRELSDEPPGTCLGIKPLEVVLAEFVVGLTAQDHVVDDYEQRMGFDVQLHAQQTLTSTAGMPALFEGA